MPSLMQMSWLARRARWSRMPGRLARPERPETVTSTPTPALGRMHHSAGGAPVAQDGPVAAGEHGGQVHGETAGARVPDGVDAAVERVQSTQPQPRVDLPATEAEREQLGT